MNAWGLRVDVKIGAANNDEDRAGHDVERASDAKAARRVRAFSYRSIEVVPSPAVNSVFTLRYADRLPNVVLGVESEHPWWPYDDVVDVAALFRDDNAVDNVPAIVFGEARIEDGSDDLLAVGAHVVPSGLIPASSRLLVVASCVCLQLRGAISRSSPCTTPACHGFRLPMGQGAGRGRSCSWG